MPAYINPRMIRHMRGIDTIPTQNLGELMPPIQSNVTPQATQQPNEEVDPLAARRRYIALMGDMPTDDNYKPTIGRRIAAALTGAGFAAAQGFDRGKEMGDAVRLEPLRRSQQDWQKRLGMAKEAASIESDENTLRERQAYHDAQIAARASAEETRRSNAELRAEFERRRAADVQARHEDNLRLREESLSQRERLAGMSDNMQRMMAEFTQDRIDRRSRELEEGRDRRSGIRESDPENRFRDMQAELGQLAMENPEFAPLVNDGRVSPYPQFEKQNEKEYMALYQRLLDEWRRRNGTYVDPRYSALGMAGGR